MSDGSITFSTSLDNSELDKQIKQAENNIKQLQKTVEQKTSKRNAIKEQIEEANDSIAQTQAAIDNLKKRLEELKTQGESPSSGRSQAVREELDKESKSLMKQVEEAEKLDQQYYKLDDEVTAYSNKLDEAKSGYSKLSSEATAAMSKTQTATGKAAETIRTKIGAAAQSARSSMANAAGSVGGTWDMVANKITKTMRKVFVFSIIVGAVRALKAELSSMIGANEQFNGSIENLKAVASGFVAAFGGVVIPAFVGVVNLLAGVLERIAGFIDFIFGSNISGMIQQARANASASIQQTNANAIAENADSAAKAQDKQAKAAKNLAKQQKKANRQLLSFDELNVLAKDDIEDATDAMGGLGSGGAGALAPDWTQGFMPDAGFFQPILDWLDEIRRRIETDVTGPFARIREGLGLIKQGISEVVQGILSGDWYTAWVGLGDIVIGILYVVQGAIWAFFDWLNEVTNGQFAQMFAGLTLLLQGIVDIIEGLLRGNVEQIITGLHEVVEGAINAAVGLVTGAADLVLQLGEILYQAIHQKIDEVIGYLIEKYPEFTGFFEGLRVFLHTLVDGLASFVRATLGNIVRWFTDSMESAKQIVHGAVDIITGLLSLDGDRIARGVKSALNGVIGLAESAINLLISGFNDLVNSASWGLNLIPGFSVPSASFGSVRLPRLAAGAVIPPNRAFMAVLGDQTSGNNLEAPESLLRQIVRDESGNSQTITLLAQILSAIQAGQTLQCDGYTLAKVVNNRNTVANRMYGAR